MHIGLVGAIFLSIFMAALITENYGYGYWMISRPVFAGPLIGLILGDIKTGLIVGASVELMYMGVLPIGGSIPPNAQIAGIIGTFFAISAGGKPEVGISLALPIGILAQFLIMLAWNINIFLVHKADKSLQELNIKKTERIHICGLLVFFITFLIPTFLAVYFGSDYVGALVDKLPDWFMDGLKIASGILPAVGMAMLLKMMDFKKYWAFFLIGFVLAVYLKLNILSIALLGLGISVGLMALQKNESEQFVTNYELSSKENNDALLDKKDILKTFVRSFFTMTTINYERYCNLGFCYAMLPALKKFYPKEEDLKEAALRHNEFYNCHPYAGNAIIGVSLALEEERSKGKDITAETISSTKAALMGPLSGIGDSIFKGTFMTIFAAIGAGLSLDGNPIGPFVFLIPNILLNVVTRYYGISLGYKFGINLVNKLHQSNIIDKFVQGATIVGMMVVGAMIVSFVSIKFAATWNFGGKEIVLQDLLDSILPSMLPLLVTLGFYSALRKYKNAIYWLILICFVVGIAGKLLGVF